MLIVCTNCRREAEYIYEDRQCEQCSPHGTADISREELEKLEGHAAELLEVLDEAHRDIIELSSKWNGECQNNATSRIRKRCAIAAKLRASLRTKEQS